MLVLCLQPCAVSAAATAANPVVQQLSLPQTLAPHSLRRTGKQRLYVVLQCGRCSVRGRLAKGARF